MTRKRNYLSRLTRGIAIALFVAVLVVVILLYIGFVIVAWSLGGWYWVMAFPMTALPVAAGLIKLSEWLWTNERI